MDIRQLRPRPVSRLGHLNGLCRRSSAFGALFGLWPLCAGAGEGATSPSVVHSSTGCSGRLAL
jgi:hypothetical protein